MSKRFLICMILILSFMMPVFGQSRVGFPHLKIGAGARQAGLGGAFTGIGDDIYTLYWNPGGIGHLRRWQWSAAYDKWFADIYQARFSYARQFRGLGSRKSAMGFTVNYLGMPEWDATGGKEASIHADHLVLTFSFGQRLDWLHPAVSIGGTLRHMSSRFDNLSSAGFSGDLGILIQPKRFKMGTAGMGIFDYGIIRFGAALLHAGQSITVRTDASVLPTTHRAGASFKMGSYHAWSFLIAADGFKYINKSWNAALGSEIWWKEIVGARIGYQFDKDNLGGLSFGIGIRWNDVFFNEILGLPTRFGDAVEINMANAGYGDVLQQTYRGAASHYSIAPEPFYLSQPEVMTSQILGVDSVVELNWEKSHDPDLFDEVSYLIVIDKSRERVSRAVKMIEYDMVGFLRSALHDSLLLTDKTPVTFYRTNVNEGGIYYWAVAAYDLAHHARLARRGEQEVGEFVVETPDILVDMMHFEHSEWITTTPEQGSLTFRITNKGNAPSPQFRFLAVNRFESDEIYDSVLIDAYVSYLGAGRDTTFHIPWETELNGTHLLLTSVDPDSQLLELNRMNNTRIDTVVSIPKGYVLASDTIGVRATSFDFMELPLVPEVYFDAHSAAVDAAFAENNDPVPGVLYTLVSRMKENSNVIIEIMGHYDRLTGEADSALALYRSEAVKKSMLELGLESTRMRIVNTHSDKLLGTRQMPSNPVDAQYHMEQNRKVTFSVPEKDELAIFGPLTIAVDTTMQDRIPFSLQIYSPGDINEWFITDEAVFRIHEDGHVENRKIQTDISWDGTGIEGRLIPRNRWYSYAVHLTDSLNRTFRTEPKRLYIREKETIRRREMFGAAKFAQTEPVYQFYWDKLMDVAAELVENEDIVLQFEGHACATGTDIINERLSYERAERFTQAFLRRLRENYSEQYNEVSRRVRQPAGFGERKPLRLKLRGQKEELLGDNRSPAGRYLNRRIMVLLYREN